MTQQYETQQTPQVRKRASGGMIASIAGLAVLVIFAIQNRMRIRIHFLFWSFVWSLWVYTIVIAVFGALVWFGWGVMRRHRRRKNRRENRRD
jgi:uncharacterized integral membrane protein